MRRLVLCVSGRGARSPLSAFVAASAQHTVYCFCCSVLVVGEPLCLSHLVDVDRLLPAPFTQESLFPLSSALYPHPQCLVHHQTPTSFFITQYSLLSLALAHHSDHTPAANVHIIRRGKTQYKHNLLLIISKLVLHHFED